jgi:hypothetical protein
MLGTRGIVRAATAVALSFGALVGAAPAANAQIPGIGEADRCDPIDPAHCMFPFPNDHFTVADSSTDTGRRIDFHPLSMPRNRAGVPINPTDYNRNDGFSPGNMIITHVPGLNSPEAFRRTGAVPITDIGSYRDRSQPVVVIDAATGERHPIWSEIDSNPLVDSDTGEPRPQDVNLLIRPAVNFAEGHRYIVALRDMREADGDRIEAQPGFRLYRDRIITNDPAVESRRDHFEEEIFAPLRKAGINRKRLFLAWDFTVASERNLSERSLSIRDDAFAQLGDSNLADMEVAGASPEFTVTSATDFAPEENSRIARRVEGTVTVPCYTNVPTCPTGSQFAFAPGSNEPQGIPGNSMEANFICNIPRSALDGATPTPAKPSLYGHGLLGSAGEVNGGNIAAMSQEHGFMFCATDWVGFSTGDLPTVATILQDLSHFPKMADRTQQGFLNFMYLGRAMIHSDGFASAPEFQTATGASVIDAERLFYDGNSQGGILGGSLTALAPDFDRAVLGVPGMNYSTLLRRSVDFDLYAKGEFGGAVCDELPDEFDAFCEAAPQDTPVGLYDNYPNQLERPLILSLIQMLWDRGEANGYAHHMTTDPLPNTPPHEALLHVAFGDHQVAQVTAEVEARTIGAVTNATPLDPGRHSDVEPLWDIPRVDFATPHQGSALVYWDSGSPTPPTENIPPREGQDPHSHPRNDVKARQQKAAFLSVDGAVTEVCGGGPCYANGYTGAP